MHLNVTLPFTITNFEHVTQPNELLSGMLSIVLP